MGTGPVIDASTPHPARIYNYLLTGKDGYAVDREAAAGMLALDPDLADRCRRNRAFLTAAAAKAATEGIWQFTDLGSGYATPSVHDAARAVNPHTRTLLVDTDPVVLSHVRALMAQDGEVEAADADLADPAAVLRCPEAALLDLSQPVCVVFGCVLHYWPAPQAAAIVAAWAERVPAGSRFIVSVPHFTDQVLGQQIRDGFRAGAVDHGPDEVAGFLDGAGLEILPPGVTTSKRWIRFHDQARQWAAGDGGIPACGDPCMVCAVARKPRPPVLQPLRGAFPRWREDGSLPVADQAQRQFFLS